MTEQLDDGPDTEVHHGARYEFHRGPARGDGRTRRSAEWYRQHDEALSRDCPLEIPRRGEEPDGIWRCGAVAGERCVRFPDRVALDRQPGHYVRINPGFARCAPTVTDHVTEEIADAD